MRHFIKIYLLVRNNSNEWNVSIHRDLQDCLNQWKSAYSGDPKSFAIYHVGFDRPKTRYFDSVADKFAGHVVLTASAKYCLPSDFRSSRLPIAMIDDTPVFFAESGWGYTQEVDESNCVTGSFGEIENPQLKSDPSGFVLEFINEYPSYREPIISADIFDTPSYMSNEMFLDRDLRILMGRYLLRNLLDNPQFDVCEFSKTSPPWIGSRSIDTLKVSVRVRNVFLANGIRQIYDIGKIKGEHRLLNLPNYGKTSIDETRRVLLSLLEEGPIEQQIDQRNTEEEFAKNVRTLKDEIDSAMENFSDRNTEILIKRFGLNCESETLERIGEEHGISRERVRQIEAKSLRQIIRNCSLESRLQNGLTDLYRKTKYPIPVAGLGVLDSWYEGVSAYSQLFKLLVEKVANEEIQIVDIEGIHYIAKFTQEHWIGLVREGKQLLSSVGLEGKPITYVKPLVVNLLDANSAQFSDLFWDACASNSYFVTKESGERILVGTGRGAEILVRVVLEKSNVPLHYSEVHRIVEQEYGRGYDERRIHNALAEVAYLYNLGVYGLDKHCPIPEFEMKGIAKFIEKEVSKFSNTRQWHSQEFLHLLDKWNRPFSDRLDKYIVEIALRKYSSLLSLGRMTWLLDGGSGIGSRRLEVRDSIVKVLNESGRPISTSEIRSRVESIRGVSEHFQVFDIDPIVRVGVGEWGLNDRDLELKRPFQCDLIDRVHSYLQDNGGCIDIDTTAQVFRNEKISPWTIFSLCKNDPRFSSNTSQNLCLVVN